MVKKEADRVLELFFNSPRKEYYIREIAKLANVSPGFSKKTTDALLKEQLLLKRTHGNLVLLQANLDSVVFRYMKITHTLQQLLKSNLLKHVQENMKELSAIVLFGSTARGEDDEHSDLDLLVIGEGPLSQTELESILKRRLSLIKYTSKEWKQKAKTDKAFYERILIDGIPLYGELPIVL